MAATQFAADTPLLVTALVATAGIFALWRLWTCGLASVAMAFVFARLCRRAGVLTDAELTQVRYSSRAVLSGAGIFDQRVLVDEVLIDIQPDARAVMRSDAALVVQLVRALSQSWARNGLSSVTRPSK